MAQLSISKAWDESREVLASDGRLMASVALALIALPTAIGEFIYPSAGQNPSSPGAVIVALIAGIIGLVGQLAIVRLAVGPSLTVGEAIGHGARQTLPYLGAVILLLLGLLILALPFIAVLAALGMDFEPPIDTVPPAAWLLLLLFMIVALVISVRLMLSSAVASIEKRGPVAILKRSWELSSGHFWRLLGFLLVFIIAAIVVLGAVGIFAGLLGALAGGVERFSAGALIAALLTALASAVVTTVYVVMVTRIYVQVSGRASASVPRSAT